MLGVILAFLPAILGIIGVLMTLPMGISKVQLFFTAAVFCGLLSIANHHGADYYHLVNLPVLGAAVTFIVIGILSRHFKNKE